MRRGGGGLVTALSGLVAHRGALWIASAMTDEDIAVSREAGGEPVTLELDGVTYEVLLVESDPEAYDRFYNVIANPILWFIQHYLWDLSNAPDIRHEEADAWDYGYEAVNADIADGGARAAIEDDSEPLVMLHDYHLYTCPALLREARPDAFLHHFVHIPWSQPDSWRILPGRMREQIYRGLLANDIIGFHTTRLLPQLPRTAAGSCMELEVDYERGAVLHSGRETWVPRLPAGHRCRAARARRRASEEVAEYEAELLRRRRDHMILRVDRADLSKNVLRGFTAFDTFLQQHPEFRERVTFIAHLQPSRTDVPEYAEYLERIEALVAVVNHRHGTTDWMPIDLRIYENFPEAVARYKHFDLLIVNSLFDGMNLVAKEAPAVNTRDGVRDAVREHRRPRGARRLHALGEPVRHPGAGRHDLPGADHGRRGARAPRRPPARDRARARSGRLDRRAARRHPGQARGDGRGELAAAATARRPGGLRSPCLFSGLDNPIHLLVIAVVVIILFGPSKFPQIGRAVRLRNSRAQGLTRRR